MLYMVIETFKSGNPDEVGRRFRAKGRMMPDDIAYVASWMETSGVRCFQIMEAPNEDALSPWIANWSDLVEFEVTPILTSADYWALK